MNDTAAIRGVGRREPALLASSGGTIRRQLLSASFFPLAFFGLLSILVTASALYEMSTSLVSDRNAAQVQALAYRLADASGSHDAPGLALQQLVSQVSAGQLLIVDHGGQILSSAGVTWMDAAFVRQETGSLADRAMPGSQLTTSPVTEDQIILSASPIPGRQEMLLMAEPWSVVMTPALYYQLVLVGLLICGTLLSLLMLSMSIGRVLQPITELAGTASRAVPGTVFRPVPERGPIELRALTASFNKMVIQLAEQQLTMRQYAQKALLSQEEERQRLSHELHDGTVQDLVGLAQRLELCQDEMESDPARAKQRLAELKELAQNTLDEVRQISNALRPSILQDLGLAAALRVLSHDLDEEMPGVVCICTVSEAPGAERRLQPDMELAVFRVAQEALTNIRKHAEQVTEARVELKVDADRVRLEVSDNGCGAGTPDLNRLVRNGHLGYAGMYERARLFGGKLEVSSSPESGTTVKMELPRTWSSSQSDGRIVG